ncbi:MAG: type II secretion system F family protein [Phenylobacterium sp.]|uniref:type II secretion system F family protein n=1 Tax=Phenylobacterium sp. TaxID=1871053 RepID=UPI0027363F05|nr:type II secretion system F family protein [Phenylobacterium sp.]MDP3748689.1 type II secretion system F family protein [Phenylobacterium sp.]
MEVDVSWVYLILVFAAVFAAAQATIGLARTAQQKRKVNRRLLIAERTAGIAELVVELRKQRGLNAAGDAKGGWVWLGALIVRSGVPYDARRWLLVILVVALVGAALAFLATRSLIALPVGAVLAGAGGPIMFLKVMAGRRSKALGEQLPQGLEIIVRSLEAGHPVPTAISLVGREMSDPIGSEFGMAADEIAYGATLEQAVERMSVRCQHPDVDLFAATVRLQERAGGNLTGLLKLNANTVRERQRMRLKIKAATSEGRVSAMILSAAPLVAGGAITVMAPDFYGDVIDEPVVQFALAGFAVWLGIGNLVMRKMVAMRI